MRAYALLICLGFTSAAFADDPLFPAGCGSLENHYGPYDYTNLAHRHDYLPIVESAHLQPQVLQLVRGVTAEHPRTDIEYTLRTFPNHHLALDALARLHRKEKVEQYPRSQLSIYCWFERAHRFKPDDGIVMLIYGVHLFALNRYGDAERILLEAETLAPDSAEVNYNLGLLYVRLKSYGKARAYAQKAYSLNFPLTGLRDQLVRAGEWQAPQSQPAQ